MSLQDCIQQALQHNFDVQIERYNPQISLYNLNAAYGGYDPTFNISGQHNYDVVAEPFQSEFYQPYPGHEYPTRTASIPASRGTLPCGIAIQFQRQHFGTISGHQAGLPFESSFGGIGVTLTQPLLKNFWIDSTRLNIRVAKNRLKYSEQGVRQQLITSVTAVINAYYELIFAQQNVQVQQQALDLAQTQLDQDNQRVQIGTLAILSVQQDESQVAQSQGQFDRRAKHARHGPKHPEKSAHRQLFQNGTTWTFSPPPRWRRRCNRLICRTVGARA